MLSNSLELFFLSLFVVLIKIQQHVMWYVNMAHTHTYARTDMFTFVYVCASVCHQQMLLLLLLLLSLLMFIVVVMIVNLQTRSARPCRPKINQNQSEPRASLFNICIGIALFRMRRSAPCCMLHAACFKRI